MDPEFADAVYGRLLDNITRDAREGPHIKFPPGTCIPQRRYCQGAAIPDGTGKIIMFATVNGQCFPAALATAGQFDRLVDGNGVVFTEQIHTINMRVEWPGYEGWFAQIRTVNYQEEPRGITRAKLLREVAKQLEKFIEKMRTAPIDPEHEEYRVGAGGIELRHIQIASLEQVSRGSWQPRLIQTTGP